MIIFCIFLYEDEINLPTYLFSNNKLINKNWMPNRTITKWFFVQRKTHFSFYRLVLRYQFIFQYLVNPPCCACDGIVISTMSPTHRYPCSLPSKHLLFLKTSSTRLYRNSFSLRWRRPEDIIEIKKYLGYLYLTNLNAYLTNLSFTNLYLTILRQIQKALTRTH